MWFFNEYLGLIFLFLFVIILSAFGLSSFSCNVSFIVDLLQRVVTTLYLSEDDSGITDLISQRYKNMVVKC